MGQKVDRAGNIWAPDASGNYTVFVGKVGGNQVVAPNQAKVRGDNLDNEGKVITIAKGRQDLQLDPKKLNIQQGQLTLDQKKNALDIQRFNAERAARLAQLNALQKQLRTSWDAFAKGPGATKGMAGLADYNPFSDDNARFDAASAGLAEVGLNAFRTPGVGSQSEKELKQFVQANRPQSSDKDAEAIQKFQNLENRLSATYDSMGVDYQPYRPDGFGAPAGGPHIIKFDKNGNRIK